MKIQHLGRKIAIGIFSVGYVFVTGFLILLFNFFSYRSQPITFRSQGAVITNATAIGKPFLSGAQWGEFGSETFPAGVKANYLFWIAVFYLIPVLTMVIVWLYRRTRANKTITKSV